jgi:hypothetical protein
MLPLSLEQETSISANTELPIVLLCYGTSRPIP